MLNSDPCRQIHAVESFGWKRQSNTRFSFCPLFFAKLINYLLASSATLTSIAIAGLQTARQPFSHCLVPMLIDDDCLEPDRA